MARHSLGFRAGPVTEGRTEAAVDTLKLSFSDSAMTISTAGSCGNGNLFCDHNFHSCLRPGPGRKPGPSCDTDLAWSAQCSSQLQVGPQARPGPGGGSCGNCHRRMFCDSSGGLSEAASAAADSETAVATAVL